MAIANIVFVHFTDENTIDTSGTTTEDVTISGTATASTLTATSNKNVLRIAVDTACYVSFGAAPDASSDDATFYLPAASVELFQLRAGDKVSVVAVAA